MGQHFAFRCPGCGYKAEVSGGNDVGMACSTSTISCHDCEELYDVMTSRKPWLAMKPGWKPKNLRCPESKEHNVEVWQGPGACPKCGRKMRKGRLVLCWD